MCREYIGIDLSPEQIATFNNKIKGRQLENVKAIIGDAVSLNEIEDCRFDVVLALGPMYHLPKDERNSVLLECKRICRDGGIIILAYANKIGAYVNGCLQIPDKYPDKKLSHSVLKEGMSDEMPGLFYMTMPEEMESQAVTYGLRVLKHAGVDFVFNPEVINAMSDKQFDAWLDICDYMFDSPTCTGLSTHALIVCQK
jgi:SAM-dependent methyltransferase